MNNILVSRGTYTKYTPKMISKIRKSVGDCESYVVVGYDNMICDYEAESFCIKRSDCLSGKYEYYVNKYNINIHALGEYDIKKYHGIILRAMLMQRRFEKRILLQFEGTLSNHYRKVINHILFWNSFLDECHIGYYFVSDAPHEVYDYIIYELCKLKGIKTFGYRYLYKTDRFFVFQDFEELELVCSKEYERCLAEYAEEKIDVSILEDSIRDFYTELTDFSEKTFDVDTNIKREFVYRFGETRLDLYVKDCLKRERNNAFNVKKCLAYFFNYIYILREKSITNRFRKVYENNAIKYEKGDNYIYFALHLLPESAVEPLGGGFSDQYLALKMISDYLPKNWKLYVKLHPAQVGTVMDMEEVKRFMDLKNVELLSVKSNQQQLIRNARAVATLTGEIAIESMIYDVPCLIFGNTYYGAMPNAIRIRNNIDMKKAVDIIENNNLSVDDYKKILFFKAMENASFKGVDGAVNEICKRIGLNC